MVGVAFSPPPFALVIARRQGSDGTGHEGHLALLARRKHIEAHGALPFKAQAIGCYDPDSEMLGHAS
jgi:hypothetical protein